MNVYVLIEYFDHYETEIVAVYSHSHLAEDRLKYDDTIGAGRMKIVECELETFVGMLE
jgi:hypothetical protein